MRKRFFSFIACNRETKEDKKKPQRTMSESSLGLDRQGISLARSASVKDTEIYGYSKIGIGSEKTECQDSYTILYNIRNQIHYIGVYDGHGPKGKDVSNFFCQQVESCLKDNAENLEKALNMGSIETFFKAMFKNAENKLHASSVDVTSSGTCCLGVLIAYGKYYVVNLGDSRAVLCRQSDIGTISVIDLSKDHKPTREDEKARVVRQGGSIEPTYIDDRPVSPLRIWSPNKDIGLCMTRAIGNTTGKQAGLISDPEITEFNLEQGDKFIIAASDGVWDVMTSGEACSFLLNYLEAGRPKSESARALAKEAKRRWTDLEEYKDDPYSDDITAIVAYIKYYTPDNAPGMTINLESQPPVMTYYYYNYT